MRVTVIQTNAGPDKPANLAQARELIGAAVAADRPDLITLPEVWAFQGGNAEERQAAAEPSAGGEASALLAELARRHRVMVHGGSIMHRDGDRLWNTTLAFDRAGKPRDQWRIGVEHEKIGVNRSTGRALPFSGPRGIERLLIELAERYGWQPVEENGRTIALRRDDVSITLEPGGQVELAGAPRDTLHQARVELATHLSEITEIGADLGIAFLGLGIHPPTPSWGNMLTDARETIVIAPWAAIFPGLAIFLTVLGFNLLGDGLRDALDPHMKTRRA